MEITHSHNGVPIRLPEPRWEHFVDRHPEMRWHRWRVLGAVADPDVIQRGDYGALIAARHYNQPPAVNLYVVAVYREVDAEDGFVVTAYLAPRLSERSEVLWTR